MPHFEDAKKAAGEMRKEWELPTGFEVVDEEDHEGLPVFINGDPFDTIAVVIARDGCHGNALLIATAPEMLEALKEAHPYITSDIVRAKVGNIIVKATGENV